MNLFTNFNFNQTIPLAIWFQIVVYVDNYVVVSDIIISMFDQYPI